MSSLPMRAIATVLARGQPFLASQVGGAQLRAKYFSADFQAAPGQSWSVQDHRFVQELRQRRDVHGHMRPGSRSVISCSIHPLPSGSLNEAYEP